MLVWITVRIFRLRLICGLFMILNAVGSAQTKASQPDVFLITIDTLRADHVHCYGYENIETPALDGLAKDGVRFTQAFTPSPITNTSLPCPYRPLIEPGRKCCTNAVITRRPSLVR